MKDAYVATIFIALIAVIAFLGIGFIDADMNIQDYKEDINWYSGELRDAENEANDWKCKYDNYQCPECPEPETIYINTTTTEYIYENIYISNAIFDVNRDRIVNHEDVCSVWAYINNGLLPMENVFYCSYDNAWDLLYDVNADGCVDVDDVDLILEHSGMVC